MKPSEVARWRMRNSGLTGSPFDAPDEAVRWHGAMQAQDYGPAKWSIAQRASNLVDEDLNRALADGSIVRTHMLRPTWHFVVRDDIRWMLALTGPRVHKHNGPRYRELGLDEKTRARSEAVIVSALEGGNHLTREEIGRVLDRAGIDRSGQRLPYLLMHCELEAAICSGGLAGKRQTFALVDELAPKTQRFDRDEALVQLVRRYLTSHGPATERDLTWWSSLTASDIRRALHLLDSAVQRATIEGVTFWSMVQGVARPPSARGVHLLQTYDELVVGYTESRYFGDPRATAVRTAWRDRSLPNGVILANGSIAGHWRRTLEKDAINVEVLLYEDPDAAKSRALDTAAKRLGRFLGRPAFVRAARL